MARALCFGGKFYDAKTYMRTQRMLEEKEMDTVLAAVGFADISSLYQKMNDYETAIPLMKRGLAVPGLPQKLLPDLCAALMSLISKSGKEKEEVSYMEDEVEKLEVSYGPEHCIVGYGYSNLGFAYLKSGQKELGVKSLANAKDNTGCHSWPSSLDFPENKSQPSRSLCVVGKVPSGLRNCVWRFERPGTN